MQHLSALLTLAKKEFCTIWCRTRCRFELHCSKTSKKKLQYFVCNLMPLLLVALIIIFLHSWICWRYFGIKLLFILKCEVFVFTLTCTSWSCVAAHFKHTEWVFVCPLCCFSAGKNSLRTLPTLRWPFLLGRPQKKKKNDLWFFFSFHHFSFSSNTMRPFLLLLLL